MPQTVLPFTSYIMPGRLTTHHSSSLTYSLRRTCVRHALDGHALPILFPINMQTFVSTFCCTEQHDSFNNLYQDVRSTFRFICVDLVYNYGSKQRKLNCLNYPGCKLELSNVSIFIPNIRTLPLII